jgi:hypothetical protein
MIVSVVAPGYRLYAWAMISLAVLGLLASSRLCALPPEPDEPSGHALL